MDPLSMTASVVTLLGVCLKVSIELKTFRNGVSEGKVILTAMLCDLAALRQVLQSMQDTFEQLDLGELMTGHIGMHWQNLLTSLQDGHAALEQLEALVKNCNKEVAFLDRARRAIRLREAMERIVEFRQQIQSYNGTLQLSLQTVILWGTLSVRMSTTQILPNLAAIHADLRRMAADLDAKLQVMQELSKTSDVATQVRSVSHMKDCVRSAATVLSSASTMASLSVKDRLEDTDDLSSEVGSISMQLEVSEATRSWILQQATAEPVKERSEGIVMNSNDTLKIEDLVSVEDTSFDSASGSGTPKQVPSNPSLETLRSSSKELDDKFAGEPANLVTRWSLSPRRATLAQLVSPLRKKLVFTEGGWCRKSDFIE